MEQLLRDLVASPGVSGGEDRIRETIIEKVEDHADSIEQDGLGNLIVRKGSGERTLMLAAHMDQIGLSVNRVDDNGFLRVSKVGGIYSRNMMDQRVTVHASESDEVRGVVSAKPVHLMDSEEKKDVPEMKDLVIDIGAESKQEVEEEFGIRVGDYITYEKELEKLSKDYVTGPAFDDRAGCAVVIEALKRFDEDYELIVVFNVQEEVGRKGARTSTFMTDPDAAIAVDVTVSGDLPFVEKHQSEIKLGDGFGIDLIQNGGRGFITSSSMKNWMVSAAEDGDHDYRRMVEVGGATEAGVINLVRNGVPSASLAIPARNIHSSVEVVKLSDMEELVSFLQTAFSSFRDYMEVV